MEENKYKIYFSNSKFSKYGKFAPFSVVLLWFVFEALSHKLTILNNGLDTFFPLFFILFLVSIIVSKKIGRGILLVEGNSVVFMQKDIEVRRFPLDNNLVFKKVGRISTSKNSYTTKIQVEYPSSESLVFHFMKMGEMMSFLSLVTKSGGKFLDEFDKPIEISEMQKQLTADPLGILFNKEKRDKFRTAVQNFKKKQDMKKEDNSFKFSENFDDEKNESGNSIFSAEKSFEIKKELYHKEIHKTFSPSDLAGLKEKFRIVAIIVVFVVGYMVLKRYF